MFDFKVAVITGVSGTTRQAFNSPEDLYNFIDACRKRGDKWWKANPTVLLIYPGNDIQEVKLLVWRDEYLLFKMEELKKVKAQALQDAKADKETVDSVRKARGLVDGGPRQFSNCNFVYVFTQAKGTFAFGIGWNPTLHNQYHRFHKHDTMQFDRFVWDEIDNEFDLLHVDSQGTQIWVRKAPYKHDTVEDIENSNRLLENMLQRRGDVQSKNGDSEGEKDQDLAKVLAENFAWMDDPEMRDVLIPEWDN